MNASINQCLEDIAEGCEAWRRPDRRSLVTRPASLLLDHLPLSEHVRHTSFIKFKHESLLINRDRQQVGVGTVDSEGGKKLI